MAKRKHSENHAAEAPTEVAVAGAAEHGADELSAERLGELAAEVRAFMDRREELASKLSLEIELTEKRLAELKRTAALLFPENAVNGNGDTARFERKSKKVSLGKTAKPPRDAAAEESPAPQPQAETQTAPAESPAAESSASEGDSGLGGVDAHGNPT